VEISGNVSDKLGITIVQWEYAHRAGTVQQPKYNSNQSIITTLTIAISKEASK